MPGANIVTENNLTLIDHTFKEKPDSIESWKENDDSNKINRHRERTASILHIKRTLGVVFTDVNDTFRRKKVELKRQKKERLRKNVKLSRENEEKLN